MCGDGWIKEGVEVCDGDGKGHGGETEDCNLNCTLSVCGDAVVNTTNEGCDDGATQNGTYNHCASNCKATGAACGDGTRNGPEVCDGQTRTASDGATVACNADCSGFPAYCGDGADNTDLETCDDGLFNGRYNGTCNDICTGLPIRCGDNIVHDGIVAPRHGPDHDEECDNGSAANNGSYGGCTAQCVLARRCGDNALQVNDHETCEPYVDDLKPKNGATCRLDTCTYCGDTKLQDGETCEFKQDGSPQDGNDGCRKWKCTYCGDGTEDEGEECDNGGANNDSNAESCKTNCSGYVD